MAIVLVTWLAFAQPSKGAEPVPCTAIDILLDPDAAMLSQGQGAE